MISSVLLCPSRNTAPSDKLTKPVFYCYTLVMGGISLMFYEKSISKSLQIISCTCDISRGQFKTA